MVEQTIPTIPTDKGPEYAAVITLLTTVAEPNRKVDFPVNLHAIAERLGIEVQYGSIPDDTVDGLLVKRANTAPFIALVSSDITENRARFTLAHEIGHYVHKYQACRNQTIDSIVERRDALSSQGVNPEEIWANQYAAALLMPRNVVEQMWGDGMRFEDMARIFKVSLAAMGVRLDNLHLGGGWQ